MPPSPTTPSDLPTLLINDQEDCYRRTQSQSLIPASSSNTPILQPPASEATIARTSNKPQESLLARVLDDKIEKVTRTLDLLNNTKSLIIGPTGIPFENLDPLDRSFAYLGLVRLINLEIGIPLENLDPLVQNHDHLINKVASFIDDLHRARLKLQYEYRI